jgi:hypothetical protein
MAALEEILRMPLKEKVLAAEAIWADICIENEPEEIPEWHKEVLDSRQQKIASGSTEFIDWEEAKSQIRNSTK